MPRVAARGQHGALEVLELGEIALRERTAPLVEAVQPLQLVDADLRRHIRQIALRPGNITSTSPSAVRLMP